MKTLVILLLVLPVLGGGVAAAWPSRRRYVVSGVALVVAAGWAVVASAGSTPAFGRIDVDRFYVDEFTFGAVLAAAAAGVALLIAVRPARTAFGSATSLVLLTAFAISAAGRLRSVDFDVNWPMLVSAAVLVVGAALVAVEEGVRGGEIAGVTLGGIVMVGGFFVDDAEISAGVTLAGVALVLLVTLSINRTGVIAAPGVLFVAVAVVDGLAVADVDADWNRVGAGVAAAGVLGAIVGRRGEGSVDLATSFAGPRVATAGFIAGLVLVAQDIPDLRSAGVLLAAGATLAVASEHPVGLVAMLPGLSASLIGFGIAEHPVHAVAGGSIVLLALTTSTGITEWRPDEEIGRLRLALPVAFAVVPSWGWTGAEVGHGYTDAVVVTVAAVAVVVVLAVGLRARIELPSTSLSRGTGLRLAPSSLGRRRVLVTARPSDGTTHPHVEAETEIDADH